MKPPPARIHEDICWTRSRKDTIEYWVCVAVLVLGFIGYLVAMIWVYLSS